MVQQSERSIFNLLCLIFGVNCFVLRLSFSSSSSLCWNLKGERQRQRKINFKVCFPKLFHGLSGHCFKPSTRLSHTIGVIVAPVIRALCGCRWREAQQDGRVQSRPSHQETRSHTIVFHGPLYVRSCVSIQHDNALCLLTEHICVCLM